MSNVYITSAARTAVGSVQGAFAQGPAPRLGAAAIREAVARGGVKPELIDEVIMGEVLTAGGVEAALLAPASLAMARTPNAPTRGTAA